MYYGVHVPHFGAYASARVLSDLAAETEAAGWDGFFIWDHLVMRWPDPVVDAWVALSAIALSTSRIRFGPLVTPLARRRPWKVAREAVSLDHLSGGRLILGVGLGTAPQEFEHFGEPSGLRQRAAMLDEALDVLTGLWRGAPFSYNGEHYRVHEALFTPPPVQSPRIPIWVAGKWPNKAPFRRAARWDGAVPQGTGLSQTEMQPAAEITQVISLINEHRTAETPCEIVHSGLTSGQDSVHDAANVREYDEAGVTWWLENVNPWRFGWSPGDTWPVDAMRQRIRAGPPAL